MDKIKEALDIVVNAIVNYSEKHPDEEVNGLIIYKDGGFVVKDTSGWTLDTREDSKSLEMLLTKEPILFDFWGILDKTLKYIYKKADGVWYASKNRPTMKGDSWVSSTSEKRLDLLNISWPSCDWRQSLTRRPE